METEKKPKTMSRRELRENVFKLLFISQFNSFSEMDGQVALFLENMNSMTDEEYLDSIPAEEDKKFIRERYENVSSKLSAIDGILSETSSGWKLERMGKVDLTILRLAVFEMLFDEDVPVKVAINEAVELAKRFGGDDSSSFVNGILGKIAKEKGQ